MNTNSTMVLDFEKNIVEIEAKIEGLKLLAKDEDVDIAHEVNRLQQKLEKQVKQSYANLTPWQKSQVARHPDRPHCLDYVHALIEDFTPLCGDRAFADDEAMIGGIGRFKKHFRRCAWPGERARPRNPYETQLRHGQARKATARRSA